MRYLILSKHTIESGMKQQHYFCLSQPSVVAGAPDSAMLQVDEDTFDTYEAGEVLYITMESAR